MKTGLGNVLGNKAGVACAFEYRSTTSFAFVTSHLAARYDRLRQRANDFSATCAGLRLGLRSLEFLHTYDHVFWFGDLNYRVALDGKHGTAKVRMAGLCMRAPEGRRLQPP